MKKVATLLIIVFISISFLQGEDNVLVNTTNKQKLIWENHQISSYILVQEVNQQKKNSFVENGVATAGTSGELISNQKCELNEVDYKTVDDLFNLVEKLSAKHGENLKVKYHPELGYPIKIGVVKDSKAKCLVEIKELIYLVSE